MPDTHITTASSRRAKTVPVASPAPGRSRKKRAFRFSDDFLAKYKMPEGRREVIQFEEGTGLGIRVSQTGQVSFIVQLKLKDGSRHRETLGAYGKLTIEAARKTAQALAGKIAMGVDLQQEHAEAEAKVKAKADAEEAKKFTVGVLIDQWRRRHLNAKRPQYALRAFRNVERTFGSLLKTPAVSVKRADVRKALETFLEPQTVKRAGRGNRTQGGPSAARNAAASLKAAYKWAASADVELLSENPLVGLSLPGQAAERERTLSTDEARRVYAAAGRLDYPGQQFIKLLMLTGARRAEIAGLRWDEIVTDGAEGDAGKAIVLPGNRTKTGAPHFIPLSQEALRVISECTKRRVVGCPYVLTSDGHQSFANFNRVKDWLDEALENDGGAIPAWRLHDFRRTIVSILAARPFRYNPVTLDLLLGHQPSTLSPVARIYQREQHIDDRRDALEAWATHLTAAPATVTKLPKRNRNGQARNKN
jgi:integrase